MVDIVLSGELYYSTTILAYLALSLNMRLGSASNKHK